MFDLITTTEKERAAVSMEAWQIKFRKVANDAPTGVIKILEPRRVFAELRPMDATNVLVEAAPMAHDSFTIVWIPPSAKASISVERDLETWVRAGEVVGNRIPVRAGVRTVRVIWTFSRALIYANQENIGSALDAVVRFTVAQLEMSALENEMDSTWLAIERDAPLTHSLTARQLGQQPHVNAMTVTAICMKTAFLRITRALEQLDPSLEDSSKRIYAELVLASALYDRLELFEDPVQFALEHYEMANMRLSEARVACKERRRAAIDHALEAAIILLLLYPLHLFW